MCAVATTATVAAVIVVAAVADASLPPKAGKEAKQANKPASITIIIIAILFWVRVSKRKYIGNICCLPRNHFAIIYGLSALPPENTFDIGAKEEKNQQNILRAVFRVYDLIAFFASYTAHASAQTPMPSAQYEVKEGIASECVSE